MFAKNEVGIFRKCLEDARFESTTLAVYNTELAEKEAEKMEFDLQQIESAQKRIDRLTEIQNQREKLVNYKRKVEEKNY